MSINAVWDDALKNATAENLTRFAQLAPKTLASASAPDQPDGPRSKGLLLTKKQIIDLRKYEAAALALPFTVQDVRDYLRFGDDAGGGSGLRAEDFVKTFSATRRHAQRWSPLRESIMLTGSQLRLFATSMGIYGSAIEDVYADVRASGLLEKHNIKNLEELKKLELELNLGDKFPGIDLEPDTVSDLGYYLDQIFSRINDNLKNVESIKVTLDNFGYDLREYVLPDIKFRVSLINSISLPADIETLTAQIEHRALRITEKNAEYKTAVEKSIGAAAGMNLVGLALAIYLGVEAENIRAERNRLYVEQEEAITDLKNKNQTLGSLNRVKYDLQGLELVAVDADVATRNLMHVWSVMHFYVKSSKLAVDGIHDALSLRRFMTAFREVVSPWKQIETDADALIAVFREADEEYERNYSATPRGLSVRIGQPGVDLNVMSERIGLMRDGAIEARVLFSKWNYLSDLHNRFQVLVRNVSEGAAQLSNSALAGKMRLEDCMRRLSSLDEELNEALNEGNEQDVEDIKADRADLLEKCSTIVDGQSRAVSQHLGLINEVLNRRLTLGFMADLEKDQQTAQRQVEHLHAKLKERQDQRTLISDAISQLETGGIEKIGKDIALTLEAVTKLGLAPPEVQLIMFAIEQLKKTIEAVGDGIRFLDMVAERDKLVETIDALTRSIEAGNRDVASFAGKAEFIRVIHSIDDHRQVYVRQYSKVVDAFHQFTAQIDADKGVEDGERSKRFIDAAQSFVAFLTPLALPLTAR